MSFKVYRETKPLEIFNYLKGKRYIDDDEMAWYYVGQVVGTRNMMASTYDRGVTLSGYWKNPTIIYPEKDGIFRHGFKHIFYHNGEGFVDSIEIIIEPKKG
jgi:hypothetical protein